jgi:hypothetical protein
VVKVNIALAQRKGARNVGAPSGFSQCYWEGLEACHCPRPLTVTAEHPKVTTILRNRSVHIYLLLDEMKPQMQSYAIHICIHFMSDQ